MTKRLSAAEIRSQIDLFDTEEVIPSNPIIAKFVEAIKPRDAIVHEAINSEVEVEKKIDLYIPKSEPYVIANHSGYHPTHKTKQFTNINIEYVSAPCAAGKTYALIKSLAANLHTKYIICVPTVALADQYEESLMANKNTSSRTAIIHGENTLDSVPSAITKLINEPAHGQIIVCTHAAFQLIEARYIPLDWVIVYDEYPAVLHPYKPQIPHSHALLTDHMEAHECAIPELLHITCKDLVKTTEWFRTHQHDDIESHIRPLVNHLRNDDAIFALKDNYERVVTNGKVTPDKGNANEYGNEKNKLFFIVMSTPEVFAGRRVIFMGADFEESWINLVWGRFYNVNFTENVEITKALRYRHHTKEQSERLHIFPFQEKFATGGASRKDRGGSSYLLDRIAIGKDMFSDAKTLAVFNNRDAGLCPAEFDLGKPILHGLNLYSKYTQAFLTICINLDETTMKMINLLGITKKEVITASHMQLNYQAASRINIRDVDSDEQCYIFCADQPTAAYIASKFQGSHLYNQNGQELVNPVIFDERTRNEKRNASNQMSSVLAGFLSQSNLIDLDKKVAGHELRGLEQVTWTGFKALSGKDSAIAFLQNSDGTYGQTKKAIEFVKILRNLHASNTFAEKKDNFLLNTCGYLTNGLTDDDVAYKSTMILDIDGFKRTKTDHMTAAELHAILKSNKIAHYIHSSSSNTPEHNKYRCYIFVSEVMDKKTYKAAYNYLVDLLKDNGFHTVKDENKVAEMKEADPSIRFTGMDIVSNRFGHRFYAPGRLNNSPAENAYEFEAFLTENRDIVRHTLNINKLVTPYIAKLDEIEEQQAIQLQFANVKPERPVIVEGSKFSQIRAQAYEARNDDQKAFVIDRINKLSYGDDRHNTAISICGSIGKIDDLDLRTELWNMLMMQLQSTGGIDTKSNLIKSGRKYAQV